MSGEVPINQVPKDYDELATATIVSPLHEKFEWKYDGQEIIIPGMTKTGNTWKNTPSRPIPLPICMLVSHHIAQKIIRDEHRKKIEESKSKSDRKVLRRESIPEYKAKCFEAMNKMVREFKGV